MSCSVLSVFFFYCSGALSDLHSFPTRRSSDLACLLPAGRIGTARTRHVPPAQRKLEERRGQLLDRKSTRLNSSHRTISYAVFCLKKKKENTTRLREATKIRPCSTA